MAKPINCPAPLPEDPAPALLVKLLTPAPYVVPEKKAKKKKTTGTQKSTRNVVFVGLIIRRVRDALLPRKQGGGRRKLSSPAEGGEKRKVTPMGEAEGSRKRKTTPPDYASNAEEGKRSGQTGPSVRRNRKFGYQSNS